jgi:hypothetical protein
MSNSKISSKNQAITPKYCAPEFTKDEIGQKYDIWLFASIILEIFSFLHDRTMQDFEKFGSWTIDSKQKWNYGDVLPILVD